MGYPHLYCPSIFRIGRNAFETKAHIVSVSNAVEDKRYERYGGMVCFIGRAACYALLYSQP